MVTLEEMLRDHQSYYYNHPEGDRNVCTKFHGHFHPSNDCGVRGYIVWKP